MAFQHIYRNQIWNTHKTQLELPKQDQRTQQGSCAFACLVPPHNIFVPEYSQIRNDNAVALSSGVPTHMHRIQGMAVAACYVADKGRTRTMHTSKTSPTLHFVQFSDEKKHRSVARTAQHLRVYLRDFLTKTYRRSNVDEAANMFVLFECAKISRLFQWA